MNADTINKVKKIIKDNQENLYEIYKDKYLPLSPKIKINDYIEDFKLLNEDIIKIDSCGIGRWNTYLIKVKEKIYEVGISGLINEEDIYYIKDLNYDMNIPQSPKIE